VKYLILLVLLLSSCATFDKGDNDFCYTVNPLGAKKDYFCCCKEIQAIPEPGRDRTDRWRHK